MRYSNALTVCLRPTYRTLYYSNVKTLTQLWQCTSVLLCTALHVLRSSYRNYIASHLWPGEHLPCQFWDTPTTLPRHLNPDLYSSTIPVLRFPQSSSQFNPGKLIQFWNLLPLLPIHLNPHLQNCQLLQYWQSCVAQPIYFSPDLQNPSSDIDIFVQVCQVTTIMHCRMLSILGLTQPSAVSYDLVL